MLPPCGIYETRSWVLLGLSVCMKSVSSLNGECSIYVRNYYMVIEWRNCH